MAQHPLTLHLFLIYLEFFESKERVPLQCSEGRPVHPHGLTSLYKRHSRWRDVPLTPPDPRPANYSSIIVQAKAICLDTHKGLHSPRLWRLMLCLSTVSDITEQDVSPGFFLSPCDVIQSWPDDRWLASFQKRNLWVCFSSFSCLFCLQKRRWHCSWSTHSCAFPAGPVSTLSCVMSTAPGAMSGTAASSPWFMASWQSASPHI